MKRAISIFVLIISAMTLLFGCNKDVTVTDDVEVYSFSFDDVKARFPEDDPGVRTDGFNNTEKISVSGAKDAIELAKCEYNGSYDTTEVAYDEASGVWQVSFYMNNVVGGGCSVYLDDNGFTLMTVGEE